MRPAAVVETIGRIVEARWPTTEAERVGLFAEVGFVDLAGGDRQFTALGGEGRWSTHDDQFLGFSLFLFEGEARPQYDELRRLLIQRFGAPLEEWGPAELPAIAWSVQGLVMSMYCHADQANCVQLALEHAERSAASERRAGVER
jgi:hypothetical protein